MASPIAKGTLNLGKRLRQESLAATGRAEHQDVRLLQFDIRAFGANALIMVIHSDRQRALRIFLTDDVLIELGLISVGRSSVSDCAD